ncbi:MAG: tetratricopeptide repeat protein, partial [Chthoniobacteraceae bacterium]
PAEVALNKTLEIDPKFSPAYGLLSAALVSNNRAQETLASMDAVLKKDPNNPRALMVKGLVHDSLQESEKAKEAYEKLLVTAPDFVPALNNLAYIYAVKLQKYDEARKLAEHARALQPEDVSVADTLGWIYFRQGDFAKALPLVQEAAAKLGDNSEVQFHLGMVSSAMGQTDTAKAAFERALQSTGPFTGKEESERRLATLKAGQGEGASASSAELAAQVAAQPTDLVLKLRLAAAYEKEGDSTKAADIYKAALAQNPALPAAATRLAAIYLGPLNQPEAAFDWAKKARALAPGDAEVAIILGRAALRNRNATQAYSLLQDASKGAGPEARIDFAQAAYAIGRMDEAVEILKKLIADAPQSPVIAEANVFADLAAAGEQPMPIEEAVAKQAGQAATDFPNLLAAKFVRARSLRDQSKPTDAISILEGIVAGYPEFFPAQRELARIYAAMPEKADRAYELATKARKAAPQDPESAKVLAAICFGRKDFAQTRQLLQSIDKPDSPLEAGDLFLLGMAQFELKEPAKSQETLQKALDAKLEEPQATKANETIDAIKKTAEAPGA